MDQPEQWSELELAKLKNYLQVTRAEMVFASGVILVEGIAERNLITAWYPELDEEGISVCSIDGVDFEIYESFLKDFEIPYVIITDWDPKQTKELVGDQNKSTNSYLKSKNRNIVSPPVYTDHNGCTLEWALLRIEFYKNIIKDIAVENQPDAGENNFKSAADACPLTFKKLWKNMDLNKGLVSKKLASEIQIKRSELLKCKQGKSYTLVQEEVEIPPYIKRAVEYLKSQCVGENTNKMGNTVGAMKLTENPVSEETVTRL